MTGYFCANCGAPLVLAEVCRTCGPANVRVEFARPSAAVSIRQPLALVAPPVAPTTEATMSTPNPHEVSPTGKPVLPTWLPALASAIVAAAVLVQQTASPHTIAFQVAGVVIGLGAALGVVSQGARKKA